MAVERGIKHDFLIENYSEDYGGLGDYTTELNESSKLLQENTLLKENLDRENSFVSYANNVTEAYLNENYQKKVLDEVFTRGKERSFVYNLTNVYVNSLYLDENFIMANEDKIRNYFVSEFKNQFGDISQLMESVRDRSNYLRNLVEKCEKESTRLVKKAKKQLDEEFIDNDNLDEKCKSGKGKKINENDNNEFDVDKFFVDDMDNQDKKKKDYIDMDNQEICNIVKDKVLQVVKDEEENNKKEQDMLDDINKVNSINESVSIYKNGVKQLSLFKSLMTKNYKETFQTLKESPDMITDYGTIVDDSDGNTNINVNMDYVMTDALLEYTKLELLNTIKITNLTHDDVVQMSDSFTYMN